MAGRYTVKAIKRGTDKSWLKLMNPEFKEEYFGKILEKINGPSESSKRSNQASESSKSIDFVDNLCESKIHKRSNQASETGPVYPEPKDVLNAFKFFKLEDTKVVLLGQDPYHGFEMFGKNKVPQAMGLSFSVREGFKVPPSLKNIYRELECDIDGFENPGHGDLTGWANQGVLLLNASLTVKEKKAGSHLKQWEKFTDRLIEKISDSTEDVVFILLGNFAKKKQKLVDKKKHCVLTGVHPSPLSASNGFFGCKVFSRANEYLEESGKDPIDWTNL